MIKTLYKKFQHWSDGGSVWLISDFHFEDDDCKHMDPNWIAPQEQVKIVNKYVKGCDTLICLGDVGNPEWIDKLNGYKVLITGNHDKGATVYSKYFDEVYDGPLFIANKILLTHEPMLSDYYLNIHGHDHGALKSLNKHNNSINLAANVVQYKPMNLKEIINTGMLKNIRNIHRHAIDHARRNPIKRED